MGRSTSVRVGRKRGQRGRPGRSLGLLLATLIGLGSWTAVLTVAFVAPSQAVVIGAEDGTDPGAGDPGAGDPGAGDPGAGEQSPPAEDPSPVAEPTPTEASEDPATEAPEATPKPSKHTREPSDEPTDDPTDVATDEPTDEPTDATDEPTDDPTDVATDEPTDDATDAADEPTDETTDATDPGAQDGAAADATVVTAAGELNLRVAAAVGGEAAGSMIEVSGAGLAPQSRFETWVFSSPQLLTTGFTDDGGAFATNATLPTGLEPGDHTIVLRGTGSDGNPIETASALAIGPDGTVLSLQPGVDSSTLAVPSLPSSPKAPAYAPVAALDQPAVVVTTAVAALALVAVAGAGMAVGASSAAGGSAVGGASRAGGGGNGGSGGAGSDGGDLGGEVRAMQDDLDGVDVIDVGHNRGWRTKFTPMGSAPGDASITYRAWGTSFTDELAYVGVLALAPRSPLLARAMGDAAPVRAITGSLSAVLPIAAVVLGVVAAIGQGGVAQPPALGLLIGLLLISVFDSMAGLLGTAAFAIAVAASGGIIGWESVRTLAGVVLLVVGPGLIASSFREIRPTPGTIGDRWERLVDLVVVPLLGAWTAMNIAAALPSLGGAAFPVADSAGILGVVVLVALVARVLLEMAAAAWFPERLATVLPAQRPSAGTVQQVLSGLLRTGAFLFVAAAFVGNVWQLWVAALLFLLPALLTPLAAGRLANRSALWQVLPDGVPKIGFLLLVSWAIAATVLASAGDTPAFAQTAFVLLAVPGFLLSILGLVARGPARGDVRWYRRPSLTWFYRIGGIVVLCVTAWLALNV